MSHEHRTHSPGPAVINLTGFDYLSYGCHDGSAPDFVNKLFGAGRGLVLEPKADKAEPCRRSDISLEIVDPAQVQLIGKVRLVMLNDYVVRIAGLRAAFGQIENACAIANEFVILRQPFFDADDYLSLWGLKLHWSDWQRNRNPLRLAQIDTLLKNLLYNGAITRYIIFHASRIHDSTDSAVIPADTPRGQPPYDPAIHAAKPVVKFMYPVFRMTGAILYRQADSVCPGLDDFLATVEIVFDSQKRA